MGCAAGSRSDAIPVWLARNERHGHLRPGQPASNVAPGLLGSVGAVWRVGRDEFPLTQEFLGQMLGVRRPTVSEIARQLQAGNLIRYRRGAITITDAAGLQQVACSCYSIVKSEFDLITGDR